MSLSSDPLLGQKREPPRHNSHHIHWYSHDFVGQSGVLGIHSIGTLYTCID